MNDDLWDFVLAVGGIIFGIWVLSLIPLWVYVTLGGLLAAAVLAWILDGCGVWDAIGSWWERKTADGRVRFRKNCWWAVVGTTVVLLCAFFPVEAGMPVAVLVALALAARWYSRRRARRRGAAVCDTAAGTVA